MRNRSAYNLEYKVYTPNGVVISENLKKLTDIQRLNSEYFVFDNNIYNSKGESMYEAKEKSGFLYLQEGYIMVFTVFTKGKTTLFDDDLQVVVSSENHVKPSGHKDFYISEESLSDTFSGQYGREVHTNNNEYLHRLNGKKVYEKPSDLIVYNEKLNTFYFDPKEKEFGAIYDIEKDKLIPLHDKLILRGASTTGGTLKTQEVEVVKDGDRYGLMDMKSGQLLVETEYGKISIEKHYSYGLPYNYNGQRDSIKEFSIFDQRGNLLKRINAKNLQIAGHYFLVRNKEDTYTLYDKDFSIIKELKSKGKYTLNRFYMTLVHRMDKRTQTYFLEDLAEGKENPFGGFTGRGQNTRGKPYEGKFLNKLTFIRDINGLIGIMDKNGKLIYPFELEKIVNIIPYSNDLLTVKKDGKFGILKFTFN